MKCIGIFSFQPDIIYLWTNKEFNIHLNKCAEDCGVQREIDFAKDGLDIDAAIQFFSPLVTSFQFMADAGNPYSSITTEDGKIVVTKQFNDLVYVAICGDGEESEWYLTRKVHVLHQLVNLLYGPATNLLKPQTRSGQLKVWHTLSKLLETWQTLSQQEQIFLVEAFERLLVNPVLNNTTLSLLEEALLKANRDGHMLHSLLLVNNKLLGLYSTQCAPELQVSDVLLLTVLIKDRFQYEDTTVTNCVHRTPFPLLGKEMQIITDRLLFSGQRASDSRSIPTEFTQSEQESRDLSPPQEAYHSASSSLQKEEDLSYVGSDDGFHTPRLGTPMSTEEDRETDSNDSESHSSASGLTIKPEEEKPPITAEQDGGGGLEYFQHNVFLKTVDCPFTPHTAHCILVDKACILIIISESRCATFGTYIYHALSIFNYALHGGFRKLTQDSFSGSRLFDKLDGAMRKLIEGIPMQSEFQSPKIKSTLVFLLDLWERAKQNDIKQYLESERQASVPIGLTSILPKLVETLKILFGQLYLGHKFRNTRTERLLKIIGTIQTTSRSKLRDFTEYLHVRGQRNVTMTAYINDFPGLVHFMYINRTANLLIAPTINVNDAESNEEQQLSTNLIIKQRLWDIWQYVEHHVTKGYTSFIVQDGDFTYSYFLWFEDNMGKALPVQKQPRPIHNITSTGTLSSNFYRNLVWQSFEGSQSSTVNCYELLCIHVGIVSNRYVAASAKKLAKWLWETSGEATSPIGLL